MAKVEQRGTAGWIVSPHTLNGCMWTNSMLGTSYLIPLLLGHLYLNLFVILCRLEYNERGVN